MQAHDKWHRLEQLTGGRNALVYPTRYAWVLYDDDERERLATLEPMWRELGARAGIVDGAAALAAVPVLEGGERPVGAVLGEAAIVHHDAALFGLLQACREAGVELRTGVRATGLDIAAGRVAGLETDGGTIPAATVVNAAGAEATAVAAAFGVELQMTPVRREALVCQPSRPFMTPAVTFYRPQEGWFNQTLRGELVAGSIDPAEPEGFREDSTFRFLPRTAALLLRKAPRLGRPARDPPVGRRVRADARPRAADRRPRRRAGPVHARRLERPRPAARADRGRAGRPRDRRPRPRPAAGAVPSGPVRRRGTRAGHRRRLLRSLSRTTEDLLSAPVIIVGGGIVGCSTAYFLAREGVPVVLLEQHEISWGASGRNPGFVWLHCRNPGFALDISLAARELYPQLVEELPLPFEFRESGGLIFYLTPDQGDVVEEFVAARRRDGLPMEMIEGAEVRRLVPPIREDVLGASYCPADAHINTPLFVRSLAEGARRHGADIREGVTVTDARPRRRPRGRRRHRRRAASRARRSSWPRAPGRAACCAPTGSTPRSAPSAWA